MLMRCLLLVISCSMVTGCISNAPPNYTQHQTAVAHDAQALMRIAHSAENAGDFQNALLFYGRSAAQTPKSQDAPALFGQARSFLALQQPQQAITLLSQNIEQTDSEHQPQKQVFLAKILILAKQADQAESLYRSVLKRDPRNNTARIGLGIALDHLNKPEEAQIYYREALVQEPNNIPARNNLALSLALSGHVTEARAMLEQLCSEEKLKGGSSTATIAGNAALVTALSGDLQQAQKYGLNVALTPQDLAHNMQFYSLLSAGTASN